MDVPIYRDKLCLNLHNRNEEIFWMYNLFSLVKYLEKNCYELLSSESKTGL